MENCELRIGSYYVDVDVHFFCCQLTQRILDAHASVQEMNLINTKLSYIRAWQALPEYGITYFIVRFRGSKKEVSACTVLQAIECVL